MAARTLGHYQHFGLGRGRSRSGVDFTGHGIGKILVPLVVRPEARKEMPTNVAALKRRLEENHA